MKKTRPVTHVTGYQWGDDGGYIGPYQFEKNRDKPEIHLPPRTTLLAPPGDLPVDLEAAWDGSQWICRRLCLSYLPDRVLVGGEPDDQPPDNNLEENHGNHNEDLLPAGPTVPASQG
ncbi:MULTISPECIES: hypothetical protein [unclassified Undibacterium]|uniref:hypothetical protein n=1 Tax=unclassified Undibacterium TaxID=2630295 RepID=UPI002AC8C332|nr:MULTISPECIES: hypothetical protein [unclassified Undibacterium]MEB0137988.1 hypothetical protein [Undibacterium sp. CCC2.1]MEB0170679.1 hypothetical protein [Undibacterium sp. CCC1.1]MEB0177020.1 hypothetical protein [Undibacterium sp. CCC3.4]MEB0216309.1 hypothetical protein [Undibacterium sp. 5I2]WPX42493.1 hypothetical protein RHM61_13985 [Undibacterium sp. CCC3.4]